MGKSLLIGVVVMTLIFATVITRMHHQMLELPEVQAKDASKKETKNLSNYAMRYAMKYAAEHHFPANSNFNFTQTFTNFTYKEGFIDSINYRYIPANENFRITTYTRTSLNGIIASHQAEAGIRGIQVVGGKGNLAHWSMDYNFLDSSTHHNDGTGNGGIRFQNNGLNNACVFPDGRNDYVTMDDDPSLDLPARYSFAIWTNWNSNPNGWIPIFWKPLPSSDPNSLTKPAYGIWIYRDYLYAGVTTSAGTYLQAVSNEDIKPQGTWHLVCVTYGDNWIKLYYDGALVGSLGQTTSPPINSPEMLYLGRMVTTASGAQYFKGRLDEVAVYDYILNQSQITAIWGSSTGILPAQASTPVIDYIKE